MKSTVTGIMALALTLGFSNVWAAMGTAEIHGTAHNSPIKGTVHFEDTSAGLQVRAQLMNVPPGEHGFHIHEFGSCAEMGKAAGGHYNPMHAQHGQVLKDGMQHAHAGDLGNINADNSGSASLNVTLPGVTLADSQYTVGGLAIVLHEKVDDFSQPAGNAGGRIACGTILVTGAPAGASAPQAPTTASSAK